MEAIGAAVPHCSAENRARLEEVVLDYVAPSERLPDGYRSMGKACFNLLSAIPEGLRSTVANARFRELERKFRQPYQAPRAISGGWVESPIDANAVTKMTDEQWLRALRKYNTDCSLVTQSDNFLRGGAVELARQLETCVVREPERFARLALQFPSDTNFQYYVHTLRGIQSAEISGDLKLQVCHKAYADCREDCGEAIADLLGEIDDPLPVDSIAMLDWLGTDHPDPESQASDDDASDDLDAYTKGLNTTRGRAALAVAVLIYKDAAYIERFNATLMRMIRDSSSAVLSCVADAIRAVMQHDVQDGLSLLAQMDITDDSLLATPSVYELVKRALQSNFQEVRSLVERMLRSERSRAAVNGAMLAALACFFHPEAEELAAEALAGNAHQRLGLAKVSAANISWERSRSWCQQRLVVLFDDADEAVRREAALAFRSLEGADPEEYADLVQSFSNSKAFCDDPSPILDVLRESIRRLPGTTCHICEKFLERFRNGASSGCTSHVGDAHTVVELLFRTYQQHQEGEWAKRSLDLIDRLCLENFDVVDETFQAFER
ncbi:hypothetical protein F183_A29680 [Bryobacterales bacterium F-183]|nr:hypothetical protein F183_A29680 [Bryobacterales bacterium F-183]